MTPVQLFYFLSMLAILTLAAVRGGHPERQAAIMLSASYVLALLVNAGQSGRLPVGEMLIDLALFGGLIWLTLKHDRWWTLVATANMILVLIAHAALILNPELSQRDNTGTKWVFGLIVYYSLLGGVVERWLAGEAAVGLRLRSKAARAWTPGG